MRFLIEALVVVDQNSDENLQTEAGIRDEVTAWLESLGAAVQAVAVRPIEDSKEGT